MVAKSETESSSPHRFRSIPTPFFVRTRYAFEPPAAPSAITHVLSFGPGELAIIHHIEPSGWGEGNILKTGSRGWIPSNYCLLYNPEPMKPLLQTMIPFSDAANAIEAKLCAAEHGNSQVVDSLSKVLVLEYSLRSINLSIDTSEGLQSIRLSLLKRVSLLDRYIKNTKSFVSHQPDDGSDPATTSATELQKLAWGIIVSADNLMNAVLGIKSRFTSHSSPSETVDIEESIESATDVGVAQEKKNVRFAVADTSTRQSIPTIRSEIVPKSPSKVEDGISQGLTVGSSDPEIPALSRPQKGHFSLAELVKYLTHNEDEAKKHQFESTLFLTWKLFCTAPELLTALVFQFDLAQLAPEPEQNKVRFRISVKQMALFCSIQSSELLGGKWLGNGAAEAPNVVAMCHLTNSICNWVKESILVEVDARIRGLVAEKWILIANYMFQIGNFDGLVAVTSGLDDSSIIRLHASWQHVSPPAIEILQSLKRIVDPSQNRRTLRALFTSSTKPHLPFLGAYLSELIFTEGRSEEASQRKTEGPSSPDSILIDWKMYARIASIISLVMDSQVPFPIARDAEMQRWIESRLSNLWCTDQKCLQTAYYNRSKCLEPAVKGAKHQHSFRSLIQAAKSKGHKAPLAR
ncbi:Ras guanine-nucleotide exchange protein [Fusarium sp. NRRL 25303]|nr:Ras guanine-nucleotide exchange protein [Fusarium sp. NRRL 25303]